MSRVRTGVSEGDEKTVLFRALPNTHVHEAVSRRRGWRTLMAKRRGHGEGSVRQRKDGRWEVRVDLGRGPDGKRRRKSAFAATQAEAVRLLKRLGGRAVDGHLLTTS